MDDAVSSFIQLITTRVFLLIVAVCQHLVRFTEEAAADAAHCG
jgi:hypothetical protein